MTNELGKTIHRWLSAQGCEVFFCDSPMMLFVLEGFWGVLYLKQSRSEKVSDRLKKKIQKMDEWSYAGVVWGGKSSNWDAVRAELKEILG